MDETIHPDAYCTLSNMSCGDLSETLTERDALRARVDELSRAYAVQGLALEEEQAHVKELEAQVNEIPDLLTIAHMQGAEHAKDQVRALKERVAELQSERDRYRSALQEMSQELSHYPEGDGIFGHLKRILRRALSTRA